MKGICFIVVFLNATLAAAGPFLPTHKEPGAQFKDITKEAGITFVHAWGAQRMRNMLDSAGGGVCFFDFDNDGFMDIYFLQGGAYNPDGSIPADKKEHSVLYHNDGNGQFTDVTEHAGVGDRGTGMACATADYNNDGRQDLLVTTYQHITVYRNNGNGTFTDVTKAAGLDAPHPWNGSAAWADVDRDGNLDLYVAQYLDFRPDPKGRTTSALSKREGFMFFPGPRDYSGVPGVLYHNNGNGTFTDISKEAGITQDVKGLSVTFADFNDDLAPDIFVASDSLSPNLLYQNDGKGHFKEIGYPSGVAVSEDGEQTSSMAIDVADYDGDGRLDFVVTNMIFEINQLYRNLSGMKFTDMARPSGIYEDTYRHVGFGVAFVDVDNDTWPDLIINNGHMVDYIDAFSQSFTSRQNRLFYRNLGRGKFKLETSGLGDLLGAKKLGRGLSYADIDNDGDMDLLMTSAGDRPMLLRNDGGNRNGWIRVRTVGTKSNRDGIGARVIVKVGGRTQINEIRHQSSYYSSHDPRLLFGLGSSSQADSIEVRWPSGVVDTIGKVTANQSVVIKEGSGIVPDDHRK